MKFQIKRKTIIALKARPERETNGQGIIDWFTNHGYLDDFLEQFAGGKGEMTYNKTSRLYEISFIPNDAWPKTFEEQMEDVNIYLSNPDDDGNYPINGYNVEVQIVSVNGQLIT